MAAIREKLAEAIEKRHWVRAFWSSDEDYAAGYPLYQSRGLVLLHETQDFHLDGYRVMRHRDLERIEVYSPRRSFGRLMAREGLADVVAIDTRPDLRSMKALLGSLKDRRKVVELHFDYEVDEEYLWLGRLAHLGKKEGKIRFLDIDATWDRGYRSYAYDEISSVRFDNEYSSVYAKYARRRK